MSSGKYEARERCRSPDCGEVLRVTHTYSAGQGAQTRTLLCPKCDSRWTQVAFIMQQANGRGTGANAVAKQIRAGVLKPGVSSAVPTP